MTTRENIGLLVVGVLGCTLGLQRCNKPTVIKGPAQITTSGGDGDVLVIQHKDANTGKVTTNKVYQPDPGSTVITTDKNGNVTVKVRQFGVGFEPGVGVGFSTKPRLALDGRFVYFKRLGFHAGLGLSLEKSDYEVGSKLLDVVDPYVGVSYVPWLRYSNTSVVVSYTADKHAFIFLRFRL
jgi:hypothetical protein